MTDQEYFDKTDFVSSTELKTIYSGNYRKFLRSREGFKKETRALTFGSIAHCLTLEPENFDRDYVVEPVFTPSGTKVYSNFKATKDYKQQKADFIKTTGGRTIVDPVDYKMARNIAKAVHSTKPWGLISKDSEAEKPIFHGILKIKPDLIDHENGIIYDLKTTTTASESGFLREVHKYKYQLSAAMYLDVANLALGNGVIKYDKFVWIAVEKESPNCVGWYQASESLIREGQEMYKKGVDIYRENNLRGAKPQGYPAEDKIKVLDGETPAIIDENPWGIK